MIEHLLIRLKRNSKKNKVLLCTTIEKSDDKLAKIAKDCAIDVFRGSVKNVLERVTKGLKI